MIPCTTIPRMDMERRKPQRAQQRIWADEGQERVGEEILGTGSDLDFQRTE